MDISWSFIDVVFNVNKSQCRAQILTLSLQADEQQLPCLQILNTPKTRPAES